MEDTAFREFLGEFKEFKGTMLEFKSASERRFTETSAKLSAIDAKLASQQVCAYHNKVVEDMETLQKRDLEHDAKISKNSENIAVTDIKLSREDKLKLDGTLLGVIVLGLVKVVEVLLGRLGGT